MRKWKAMQSVRDMKWSDHMLYWGYPLFISLVLMLLYFQGSPWMQELTAPVYNREFGLLENIQNILLLLTAYMSLHLLISSRLGWIRFGYLLMFIAAAFTFLEEIDYGYHYINYLNDADAMARSVNHNIHNTGNTTNYIRLIFYILVVIFVIILPYVPSSKQPSWVNHFVPTVRLQLTLLAMLITSKLVGIFNEMSHSTNMALHGNLSEFEELCLYYLLMMYVYRLYYNDRRAALQKRGLQADSILRPAARKHV
jgi:hypothetical protein